MSRDLRAFSLVEVVIAIGVIAASVVAVVGLIASTGRMTTELNDAAPVRRLAAELKLELERVRDALPTSEGQTQLGQLAVLLAGDGLRLVADRDARRLRTEVGADGPDGIPARDRFYLIEVQSHAGALAPSPGGGFLALSVRVRWPYLVPTGPDEVDVTAVAPESTHRAFFNVALTP